MTLHFKKNLIRFYKWRNRNISDYYFLLILAVVIGFISGIIAFVIKNAVFLIQYLLKFDTINTIRHYLYFIYPVIGIALAVIIIKYILKQKVDHGIPGVLYAISKNDGFIKFHNLFSSIITSSLTVGFGGSVGLEGPTVATGAAYGSAVARLFNLNYKQRILLLGCAAAASMGAIFKAPIAGIVFALEVIMVDLTMASLIPILTAAITGAVTAYFLFGLDVIYPFEVEGLGFKFTDLPYYIILGIVCGLVGIHFKRIYLLAEKLFDRIKRTYQKLIIGALLLGILLFTFPSLYGEGYETINSALHGDYTYLFLNSVFENLAGSIYWTFILFVLVILLKVVATAITFGSGGVGGIFAPTLFTGVNLGLAFAVFINFIGFDNISNVNFALFGMGGMIAAVLHAPLTSVFLIGDLTGGYDLLVPLAIVSTFSFLTIKIFEKTSIYTHQLAKRGELLTHHKDHNVLLMMKIKDLIETDFIKVNPEQSLGELVQTFLKSTRNIFPVVDEDGTFLGIVTLEEMRNIMFDKDLYNKIHVSDLMFMPVVQVSIDDSMQSAAQKIQSSGRFNVVVLDNGKYLGFISRANVFSSYRKMLEHFSDD